MALDDGPAWPGPVCDPVSGRDRDLLERRAADAGGGGLQALLLDGVLCGLVPPTAPTWPPCTGRASRCGEDHPSPASSASPTPTCVLTPLMPRAESASTPPACKATVHRCAPAPRCAPASEPGDCGDEQPVCCGSLALPGPAAPALTDVAGSLAQVSYIEFSPDERYVLSYSSREPASPLEKAALQINVFDAQSGAKLRKFEGSIEEFAVGSAATGDGSLKWPIFKWAASGCVTKLLLSPFLPTRQSHGCRLALTTSCKAACRHGLRLRSCFLARSDLQESGEHECCPSFQKACRGGTGSQHAPCQPSQMAARASALATSRPVWFPVAR